MEDKNFPYLIDFGEAFLQEEGWVVCRAFKKRTSSQSTKSSEGWESSYFYDHETSGVSSIIDPIDYITRQRQNNIICKQEIEAADNLSFLNTDHFVQLPQLESPSLPLIKRPSFISLISENNEDDHPHIHHQEQINISSGCNINNNMEKVTDWRALDKLVASQLSQENRYDGEGVSNFGADHNHQINDSDNMGLLLMQSSSRDIQEAGNKLKNGFLSSVSDGDIGFCIFEK
ncbi:hypothetical protein BVC80_9015g10 [Macleaya cordata]|uniref:NAC domain n=1 Tax=Macleaya cordata TaxID=56857 RepID=A0A200QQ61_MACCD|nr:hypothetical protein BVC80_9015g10 [Macleaya cordata]